MALCVLRSVILMLFCAVLSSAWLNSKNVEHHNYNYKDEVMDYLFQNRTNFLNTQERQTLRKLPIEKTPYDGDVTCVVCRGLDACKIINGNLVQEVYYPKNPSFLESCHVLDALGKRMRSEIFGVGRTFRDTSQCRG